MLDCGAFSAWRRGEVIDLPAYIEFVKSYEHLLDCYVALDVIPGSLGRAPGSLKRPRTLAEIKVSGAQSYANLQAMKEAGLRRAIPTFHQGEELCWLERMLRDGESYIGISPAKNMPWYIQQPWLDRIFAIVTDRAGNALVKIHGFGIASVDFLKRYPFFSCDTAGWCSAAAKGKIYAPSYANGSPSYLCRPTLVTISQESEQKPPKHKYNRDRQFTKLTPEAQTNVAHFIVTKAERTLAEVKRSPEARAQAFAAYYQALIAALPDNIRFAQPKSLHATEREVWEWLMAARQPIKLSRPKLYFSTQNDKQWIRALAAVGARDHLLSFAYLKERPGVLASYLGLEDAGPPCR
jgi:hypothetical protein